MFEKGSVLLHDSRTAQAESLLFTDPVAVVATHAAGEVGAAFARIETALAQGLWAAGYCTYEAGLAFEARLAARLPAQSDRPLLWFGLYERPQRLSASRVEEHLAQAAAEQTAALSGLAPLTDRSHYDRAFAAIMDYLRAGDVYQVNLTFRVAFTLAGSPAALYRDLVAKQPRALGAVIDTGDLTILSRSPELFVEKRGDSLIARPMKGTLARGRSLAEDEAAKVMLAADPKNRAENLMIVDLMRNDLGRISKIGSVRVTDLFSVETHPSLHQMTSGIEATALPGLSPTQMMARLFPSGSITGAPKIRAMQIIADLETGPRGVYTGAIGHFAPNGDFRFNVAIRTAAIGREGRGEIGVGGGIVADSEPGAEYDEALLKLRFFTAPAAPPLTLIETLRWEAGRGYWLLDRHLARLAASARYFAIPLQRGVAEAALEAAANGFTEPRMRVRLTLDAKGAPAVTAVPLGADPTLFRFGLATERVDSHDPFRFHKTTHRALLDNARNAATKGGQLEDVVFLNERGELTEGSITTLFVRRDGLLLTPALTGGLLPGTLRAELLAKGEAKEAVLTPADLVGADALYLGNSVRGLVPAQFVAEAPSPATPVAAGR